MFTIMASMVLVIFTTNLSVDVDNAKMTFKRNEAGKIMLNLHGFPKSATVAYNSSRVVRMLLKASGDLCKSIKFKSQRTGGLHVFVVFSEKTIKEDSSKLAFDTIVSALAVIFLDSDARYIRVEFYESVSWVPYSENVRKKVYGAQLGRFYFSRDYPESTNDQIPIWKDMLLLRTLLSGTSNSADAKKEIIKPNNSTRIVL